MIAKLLTALTACSKHHEKHSAFMIHLFLNIFKIQYIYKYSYPDQEMIKIKFHIFPYSCSNILYWHASVLYK